MHMLYLCTPIQFRIIYTLQPTSKPLVPFYMTSLDACGLCTETCRWCRYCTPRATCSRPAWLLICSIEDLHLINVSDSYSAKICLLILFNLEIRNEIICLKFPTICTKHVIILKFLHSPSIFRNFSVVTNTIIIGVS